MSEEDRLRGELLEARLILRAIEWCTDDADSDGSRVFCPECGGLAPGTAEASEGPIDPLDEDAEALEALEGHAAGCRLAAFLAREPEHAPDCDLDEDCACQ